MHMLGVAPLGLVALKMRGAVDAQPRAPVSFESVEASTLMPTRAAPHWRGLVNPDIYCFFNSVVQGLASLPLLAAYLDDVAAMASRYGVTLPVTNALRELLIELNTPHATAQPLVPRALLKALSQSSANRGLHTLVSAHQQQDAHELAVLLVDALDVELGRLQHTRHGALAAPATGLRALLAPSLLQHGVPRTRLGYDGDHAAALFRGTLAQRTACTTCGYMEAVRYFSTTELDMVVPGASCRVEQCLALWAQLEQVDWVCHRCSLRATSERLKAEDARLEALPSSSRTRRQRTKTQDQRRRVEQALESGAHEAELAASHLLDDLSLVREPSATATKQVLVGAPPPVLFVHLNRSTYALGAFGASKNNARVVFGPRLDLAPFMVGGALSSRATQRLAQPPSAPVWYNLAAVVVHYGAHSMGHYVCFRRRPDGSWTRISDANVQKCTWDDVETQNPYLLLYERDAIEAPKVRTRAAMARARTWHRWDAPAPKSAPPLYT